MSCMKDNAKEDGKQDEGPVFYQCHKCATFFRSKPLAAIHLWTAGHGKPTSDGWNTVPFPTPILKLHKLPELIDIEAPEIKVENDVDQESPASPLFVAFETEFEFGNVVELNEPRDESTSSPPPSSANPCKGRMRVIPKYRPYDYTKAATIREGFQAAIQGLMGLKDAGNATLPLPPVQRKSDLGIRVKITCSKCGLPFSTNFALRRHQHLVKDCSPLSAGGRTGLVGFRGQFKTSRRVAINTSRLSNFAEMKCDECDLTFISAISLERHLRSKLCLNNVKTPSRTGALEKPHSSEKLTCVKCGLTFDTPFELKRHRSLEKNCKFKLRICPVSTCRKSYNRPGLLEAHVRFIHDTKNGDESGSQCAICGEEFDLSNKLLDHLTQKHDVDPEEDGVVLIKNEEMIIEDESDVGDDYERSLLLGLETEGADKVPELAEPWDESKSRNATFTNPEPLLPPEQMESVKTKPTCGICGLAFSTNSALRQHHLYVDCFSAKAPLSSKTPGEKKAVPSGGTTCDNCGITFLYATSLERHLRKNDCVSTKTATFPLSRIPPPARITCGNCGVTFGTPSGLRRHKSIVKNCKRRICPVSTCLKSFYRPDLLEAHVRLVHGTKNGDESGSQCAICGKEFELCGKLQAHLVQKHASRDDVDQQRDSVVLIENEEIIIEDESDVGDDYERSLLSGLETGGADKVADVKLEDDEMEEFTEHSDSDNQNRIFDILDKDDGTDDLLMRKKDA